MYDLADNLRVDGFRIDAAKHMAAGELQAILGRVNRRDALDIFSGSDLHRSTRDGEARVVLPRWGGYSKRCHRVGRRRQQRSDDAGFRHHFDQRRVLRTLRLPSGRVVDSSAASWRPLARHQLLSTESVGQLHYSCSLATLPMPSRHYCANDPSIRKLKSTGAQSKRRFASPFARFRFSELQSNTAFSGAHSNTTLYLFINYMLSMLFVGTIALI